jgi:photosystem II stability/assembly factor-like uncharacterized protein
MQRSFIGRKGLVFSALLILLLAAGVWFVDVRDLCAHSPHDPIDSLALSPVYHQDRTLFVIISDHIFKSTDEGASWKELVRGLDHTHVLSSVGLSPSYQSDGTLFVSSDGDGIYRSQDGGSSWVKVDNGLANRNIGFLSIYPGYRSDNVVLAAGTEMGLYRTADGGDHWNQVLDDGVRVTAVAFSPDLGKDWVFAGDSEGTLYRSTDRGETWSAVHETPNSGAITSIAVSPHFSSDGTFLVGTEKGGIFKTVDGGDLFVAINEGLRFTLRGRYATLRLSKVEPIIRRDEKNIVSLAISPDYENDSSIFATMWNEAVFKSDDGGQTWKRYPLGLTCDSQADTDEYKSPHFRNLGMSPSFAEDRTIFLGGFDGLFKSVDGGRHWAQMETLPLGLIKGLALSPGGGDDLSVAITTYGGGAYTTYDQGDTWVVGNKGLKTTRLSGIVFSPCYSADGTIFSAARGYILKSTDKGASWAKSSLKYTSWRTRVSSILTWLGLPSFLSRQILSDEETTTPFATVFAISPDFESDGTIYFGTRDHGIFKSTDGGASASAVWDGMARTIASLVISPDFSSDGTLFASVRGAGVYRTMDGGNTWEPVNDGFTFIESWQSPMVHDITERDIQLMISPSYGTDETLFAAASEGLFKTVGGGESWQELKGSDQVKDGYIIGMAISPNYAQDETLLVSVRGIGLFKTDDGGATFDQIGSDLIASNQAVELLQFSASYAVDDTIYAASDEALFRSTDGGSTWETISRPVRYENMREVVHFEGEWTESTGDEFSASSITHSDVAGDRATLNFVGTGVSWIGTESDDQGIARVYVDGNYVGDVDQFGDKRTMVRSYSVTDLAYGPHTIAIEVTGTKDPQSAGYRIALDAFDILP